MTEICHYKVEQFDFDKNDPTITWWKAVSAFKGPIHTWDTQDKAEHYAKINCTSHHPMRVVKCTVKVEIMNEYAPQTV